MVSISDKPSQATEVEFLLVFSQKESAEQSVAQ